MTGLTIRRAQTTDSDAIMDLLRQVNDVHAHGRPDLFIEGKTKYTPDELARIIADDARPIFVAIDTDGTLLGYAFCVDEDHTGSNNLQPIRTLYIDDICVDEAARGKHVGTALYNHVLDYARAHGYYNVTLNAWAANPAAVKFYEHLGMSVYKYGMEQVLQQYPHPCAGTGVLADIMRNPFESTGKPEPLQWDFGGAWSRRISEKHRIIYMPMADVIAITSC